MSPVATSDAAFRGGACPTPEYTIAYTGNYTTSADASVRTGMFNLILIPDPAAWLTERLGPLADC